MELHINHLPENNLFRVLLGRNRYNNNGILKHGFLGVFCVKSGFWKAHIKQDIDELKNEIHYDRVIILNDLINFNFNSVDKNTLLVVDCSNYVQKYGLSERLFLPAELIGIASVPCSRKISVVLIMDNPEMKTWMNADFIYLEEFFDIPEWAVDYKTVKPLKVGGYDENYVVDANGIKILPLDIQDMGAII